MPTCSVSAPAGASITSSQLHPLAVLCRAAKTCEAGNMACCRHSQGLAGRILTTNWPGCSRIATPGIHHHCNFKCSKHYMQCPPPWFTNACTVWLNAELDCVFLHSLLLNLALAYMCQVLRVQGSRLAFGSFIVEARLQPSPGLHKHGERVACYAMRSRALRCLHVVWRSLQQAP